MSPHHLFHLCCATLLLAGCSGKVNTEQPSVATSKPAPVYFAVDPATAGSVTGTIS
jgi:hypothetical protein